MKNNKLFERLDNLDSYVLKDPNEEITISYIQVFCKKGVRADLINLPDKSFKMFYINGVILGFIYFRVSDFICNSEFFDYVSNDSETDKISKMIIEYKNTEYRDKDLLYFKVHWNSFIYDLDNGYSILLFMAEELDNSILKAERGLK